MLTKRLASSIVMRVALTAYQCVGRVGRRLPDLVNGSTRCKRLHICTLPSRRVSRVVYALLSGLLTYTTPSAHRVRERAHRCYMIVMNG